MKNSRNFPTVVIVYGATGDLMTRKIVPALLRLFLARQLPAMFRLIGVSRRNFSEVQFREHVRSIICSFAQDATRDDIERFISLCFYYQGTFDNRAKYEGLAKEMGFIDNQWNVCSNKLFYLAVPPEYYQEILTNLHDSHLTDPCSPEEGWTRILVEKPFGKNLKSARELDDLLGKLFREEQIYRIDHYLGKEMIQNILTFRFANNFLEQSWNGDFIEQIDIRLLETNGVEKRGVFYDGLGAFRDVGQNHLLQMLALVTMDNPGTFTADHIRSRRAEILSHLVFPDDEMVKLGTLRAQYEGYRTITGVHPHSEKDTYFKVRAELNSPRWSGVPIYLSSGKRFPEAQKDITIHFRHPTPCLCPPGKHMHNTVVFSLEPSEHISISFLSKVPGLTTNIKQHAFEFKYRAHDTRTQYVEEYEKLLLDCILGDQTLFVSTGEVDSMWRFTDRISEAWERKVTPLLTYMPNTFAIARRQLPMERLDETGTITAVGVVGLGKMGSNLAKQLVDKGYRVVGWNRTTEVTKNLLPYRIEGAYSFDELVTLLSPPRVVLLFLPAGVVVDEVLTGEGGLIDKLSKGDTVIDAGNSFFQDTIRRAKILKSKGIHYIDVGVSGGPPGARAGASLMVGSSENPVIALLKPLFTSIAAPRGVAYFSGIGAGHFVKMVHNGIEYGMMQALAEGFTILKNSSYKLDLTKVAEVYNHGSVIESKLVKWLADAFTLFGTNLASVSGTVAHTGEGKWTIKTARELGLKTKIIEAALQFRIDSEKHPGYTGKILSALRNRFGGHGVR